jgi:hypothetical protein
MGGLLALGLVAGCASPGPPHPPSLMLPKGVTDLTVARIGGEVKLHWTTPERTTDGLKITGPITAEICRDLATVPVGQPPAANAQRCFTVGHVAVQPGASEASDVLPPALTSGPTQMLAYRVQLLNAKGHTAGPSAAAFTVAGPAPPTVEGFHGTASKPGAVLEWQRQSPASGGDVIELERVTQASTAKVAKPARFQAGDPKVDPGGTIDRTTAVGETYFYTAQRVRTLVLEGHSIELRSAPSAAATVAMLDIFPPNAPEGLVTSPGFATAEIGSPNQAQKPAIDLSWEPGMEPRIAGYRVYRRDMDDSAGAWRRLNSEVVAMPAYRDLSVVAEHKYAYRVTAVDEAGNESGPSAEIEETARGR